LRIAASIWIPLTIFQKIVQIALGTRAGKKMHPHPIALGASQIAAIVVFIITALPLATQRATALEWIAWAASMIAAITAFIALLTSG